jgi:hypothetical protein
MTTLLHNMLPSVTTRQHQIVSEFSFWPSSPPRESGYQDGGIFEMRTYQLQPGKLLEWEGAWKRGLEARRKFVVSTAAVRVFMDRDLVLYRPSCLPFSAISRIELIK